MRSRLRYETTAGTADATSASRISPSGQRIGLFHAARSAARFSVSTFRYLVLLGAMFFVLPVKSHEWRRLYSLPWLPQIHGASRRAISTMRSMIFWRSDELGMFFI